VVGLGNPTPKYEKTRHNVGFMALDFIARKNDFKIDRIKFKALTGEGVIEDKRCLFMKPSTFMNNSGQAVLEAMKFYKIPIEKVIVIFDDVSLPVAKLRVRQKGSAGGHNGLKSIISLCGSDEFPRIKIGVGEKPHKDYDLADWVLSNFSKNDEMKINSCFNEMLELLGTLLV
jgi:PTH1 family peptidyl-tRNA hydrolase